MTWLVVAVAGAPGLVLNPLKTPSYNWCTGTQARNSYCPCLLSEVEELREGECLCRSKCEE